MRDYTKRFLQTLFANNYIRIGGTIMIIIIFCSLFAPLLTKYDPLVIDPPSRLQVFSKEHILGTDELGRDLFSRILYGGRVSLKVGFFTVVFTTFFGTLIGLIAVYYKRINGIIMRIMDGLMAFPDIIIAITLAAIWGSGMWSIIIALSVAYLPRNVRLVHGTALSVMEMEYVESARAIGSTDFVIIFKYLLPNCISPIIVQAAAVFASAILSEAALSFLGVGIAPPTPTWGGMINGAKAYLTSVPTLAIFPGIAIALVVLGLNMFGDGLRDVLDPRLRD